MGLNHEERQIYELLSERRAHPVRDNGHRTYKFPDGRTFTLPGSPSDQRWALNSLSDLKKLLGIEREKKELRERKEYFPGAKIELESDYSFVKDIQPGESLAAQLNRLTGENKMRNLTVSLEARYAHLDDVCLVCSGPMYESQKQVDWFNKMIDNKTEDFKARTKCGACKAKWREATSILPTAPVTYQVKPGVTVTKQVPVVPEAPPQTVKAPDYAGGGYEHGKQVYLKPSVLVDLRAITFRINKSSLAQILGITPTTITKWCRDGKLPRCPGRDKMNPVEVADCLEKHHEHWEVESGHPAPIRAAYVPPVRPEPKPEPAPVPVAVAAATSSILPDHDLLKLVAMVLGDDNQKLTSRLVTEIRARYGEAQPTREMLRWLMAA